MSIAISAADLTLKLPIHARWTSPAPGTTGMQEVGGRLEQKDSTHAFIRALDGVSFEIKRGQRVGLIGHNGAGKTSLLKVLAGIYPPTQGKVIVQGRISTLFSSAIGFNVEATGYENIMLMGVLLGFGKKAILDLAPEIADFSELGQFLDMPLRTYSAGMRTRLGFAIATSIRPDCLLIDEVMGAGDARFQRKAKERITTMMQSAYTLILASHSLNSIHQFCDSALWLDHGKLRGFGPIREIVGRFKEENKKRRPAPAS